MPGTPSVREDAVVNDVDAAGLVYSSCPPEDDRDDSWMQAQIRLYAEEAESAIPTNSLPTPPSTSTRQASTPEGAPVPSPHIKMDIEMESKPDGMISPVSIGVESKPESEKGETKSPSNAQPMALDNCAASSSSMDYEFSNVRLLPSSPSSFLRPGSRFTGTQQSEKQVYAVQVDVKQVDMRESYMCGFLKIEGLTEDHPSLTTFFEGEIIGTQYTFLTAHPDWGATKANDLTHWDRFPDFTQHYKKAVQKGNLKIHDAAQKEVIFMRWKEHFLVPDHRVRTISGASFEGFYYIAFDQVRGRISGTYFHAKSEKFQKLELVHVEDRGTFPSVELR